jgi:hypothetical protein
MVEQSLSKSVVYLRLLYDAFAPETVETHELQWRPGATLKDYLKGLPEDCEWMIFHDGEEVDAIADGDRVIARDEVIGLILVPQGGGSFKSVLRIALQAAAVAAAFIPGIGWAGALAINLGVGLVNAFLLVPKPPKNSGDDSKSYGIDGAKNSATENIPYPVVYGEFRTAGNFSDCFTQNVGDDQYLYIRAILNDGEIHSVSDIEINEQPASSFEDVEARIAYGTLEQGVNDWFANSVVQINKSQRIDTGWVEHITTTEVDKVRFDVTFTTGLVHITDKGKYKDRSVTFNMEVQQIDPETGLSLSEWANAGTSSPSTLPLDANGDGKVTIWEAAAAKIRASKIFGSSGTVEYREVGTTAWVSAGVFSAADASGYIFDQANDGSIAGNTDITPAHTGVFSINLDSEKTYEVRATEGVTLEEVTSYPSAASSLVTVTDKRTRQIRKSFETGRLERGYYKARIRRTNATSTSDKDLDEVYLTDVAEIEMDRIALKGTANLALKIKLSEQLNGIPSLTGIVKGSILQEYDIEGTPTIRRWSANPAWIGLDLLCGIERGSRIKTSRIDWPRWVEFAEYCDQNGITFNGVFDTGTNVGDALQQVLRIGHAAPVPFGTKISVAIDRPRLPTAVFTSANILKDTFEVGYMSMADRSNEYEVTYYDKTDRNKAKALRYVDPKAVTFNEVPRTAQVQLVGVDNHEQAKVELWRMIYANRLLIRTVNFESFMDSINMNMGEVALIQHDQMEWADSGRLLAGNTDFVIRLDRNVDYQPEQSYSALVHFDSYMAGVREISGIVGQKILVTGAGIAATNASRIIIAGRDFEVVKLADGSSVHTITVAGDLTGINIGSEAQLWITDALFERPVSNVELDAGGRAVVTLAIPLPAAPGQHANFVFGKVENVRKPFVLTGISGNGIEKRKLTFVEYHEGVYGPPEVEIPIPTSEISLRDVGQVQTLLFDYEPFTDAAKKTVSCRVHWTAGSIRNYAGADVYMSLNGSAFRAVGSAAGLTEYHLQLSAGDDVVFRVVAYNDKGDRAPASTAPVVRGSINAASLPVDAPPEGEWTAEAVHLTQGNATINAIKVSGENSNPAATGIAVFFREKNGLTWISAGSLDPAATDMLITAIKQKTLYEVGVAYVVNQVTGEILNVGDVTTLESMVGATPADEIENRLAELEADASAAVQLTNDLQIQVDADILSMQSQVSGVQSDIASLSSSVQSDISALETEIAGINPSATPNLLENGGFENGLTGWSHDGNWAPINDKNWGVYAFRTSSANGTFVLQKQVSVTAGNTYTLSADTSFWASGGLAYVDMVFQNDAGTNLLDGVQNPPPRNTDFSVSDTNRKAFKCTATAPTGATKVWCRFVLDGMTGMAGAAVRRMKLELGDKATSFTSDASAYTAYQTGVSNAGTLASLSSTVSTQGSSITTLQSSMTSANTSIASLQTTINASSNPNLLVNGGFENQILGWTPLNAAAGGWAQGVWNWGRYAGNNTPWSGQNWATLQSSSMPSGAGDTYTASADSEVGVSAGSGVVAYIEFAWFNSSGTLISQSSGASRAAPHSFDVTGTSRSILKWTATSPANTASFKVSLIVYAPSGATVTSMNWRQAKVEKGTIATPYSGEATASQMYSAYSTLNSSYASTVSTVASQGSSITALQTSMTTAQGNISTMDTLLKASSNANMLQNASGENGLTNWSSGYGPWSTNNAVNQWGQYFHTWNTASGDRWNHLVSDVIYVDAGMTVTLSADAYMWMTSGSGTLNLEIRWLNASSTYMSSSYGVSKASGFGFDTTGANRVQLKVTGTAPANTVFAQAVLVAFCPNGSVLNSAGFRQVKMELGSVATPYSNEATLRSVYSVANTANSSVASLSTTVSTQGSSISTLQSSMTTVQGSVATLQQKVTSGSGNLMYNSEFAISSTGWGTYGSTGSFSFSRDLAGDDWRPLGEHTLGIYQGDAAAGYGEWTMSTAMAVSQNAWYEYSASVACHRSYASMYIAWLDVNGAVITYSGLAYQTVGAGGKALSSWTRLSLKAQAPANAYGANVLMRKEATIAGNGDSYLWFCRPMFREVDSNFIGPSAYTPSGNRASIETMNTSVNGVLAKYGVTLDVNGYVTGFQQLNNGSTGSFQINADYFAIVKPGGGARTTYANGAWKVYDQNGVLRAQFGNLDV